ncbi:hypothetical protein DASB73_034100 [Starmerella bacillaris]|uniref:Protein kinase domain-containing protein n=1 Tax=Starmerella bacillaris TaxID=1247836 RepID=A0AAV5RNC2_STABA|nr:hypothetical protein DASB73_034100 [Starmerella bacillaris]
MSNTIAERCRGLAEVCYDDSGSSSSEARTGFFSSSSTGQTLSGHSPGHFNKLFGQMTGKVSSPGNAVENKNDAQNAIETAGLHSNTDYPPVTRIGPFDLGRKIGHGRRCVVREARRRDSRKTYAIKLVPKKYVDENYIERMLFELRALHELDHPHIVKIHQIIITDSYMGFVMDLAACGDVYKYLSRHGPLGEQQVLEWGAQLVSAVEHMHRHCYAHRDIKPENILVNSRSEIILTDFEFCTSFKRCGFPMVNSVLGTPPYCAPEGIVSYNNSVNVQPTNVCKADIWSVGMSLYTMACGYLPFNAWELPSSTPQQIAQMYMHIVNTALEFPYYVKQDVSDLISSMLEKNPDERITVYDLKLIIDSKLKEAREYSNANYGVINSFTASQIVNQLVVESP